MSLPEQLGDNALAWARLGFSSKPRILEKLDTIQIEVSISFSLTDDISLSQPIVTIVSSNETEQLVKRLHRVLRQRLIFRASCATNTGIKFLLVKRNIFE